PQRTDVRVGVVLGVEQRVMPVGQGTVRRVGREVGAEPLDLCRGGGSRHERWAAAVQYDDVPGAEVVAVVALLGVAGGRAEIAEVAARVGRLVVQVTGRRLRARLVPPPGQAVTGGVLRGGAVVVGVVAVGEDGARNRVEQAGRRRGAELTALGDVPRTHQRDGAGAGGEARGREARRLRERLG